MAVTVEVTRARPTNKASVGPTAEIIDINRAATDKAATKATGTAKAEALRKFTSWETRLDACGSMPSSCCLD